MLVLIAYTRGLEVRSDLLELLPRESPGFRAFEHQLGRVGGRSTLTVIVQSPERAKNEQFVDDLAPRVEALAAEAEHCRPPSAEPSAAQAAACPGSLIAYVESGTKDVRAFYDTHKWLYADLDDLREADAELDRQIALRSGLVEDLDEAPRPGRDETAAPRRALGMADYLDRWDRRAGGRDTFPTGYFANQDGTLLGLRIVSNTSLGDARGDVLLSAVGRMVNDLGPGRYHAAMRIGFTGDIASAADEKNALVNQAVWVTGFALVVILVALVAYYRSIWSLVVIALPALFGVVAAYAFAKLAFGYINVSGAFLGAIILGNGINYPIVLLSRYHEFRARGMPPGVARREAVLNSFRAELVGACVASIAYGSLVVTRFRGFNQFGAIGFVGMLVVWASIIPLVPALIVLIERLQPHLPRALRDHEPRLRPDGSRSIVTRTAAAVTARRPWLFVAAGFLITAVLGSRIPRYLVDPWEYDFGKLGSRRTEQVGAGEWSNKANDVFGGKANIAGALMLADTPEQAPLVKQQILENDKHDPLGHMIDEVTTIDDLLPGTDDQQRAKLAVLDSLRGRLTERVVSDLTEDEQRILAKVRPPDDLRVLRREDLPLLLRRRFSENSGRLGTVLYVKPRGDIVFADGHNHLRLSRTTDNVRLPDGTVVMTASRSTIFAEILTSIRRDGPLASLVAFVAVVIVVVLAARSARLVASVLIALVMGVTWLVGWAAVAHVRINYVNFIALPITLGIGCEYPFNIADRTRLLGGNASEAVRRSAGAVMMCSFTTAVGYGSLLFSDFQALESFGKLAVLGEIACVFAAVFFLPALFVALGRIGKRATVPGASEHEIAS
jgi:preprotein translocase subunit SecF